ncbi:MAG: hypothetical protein IPK12_22490 [Gemmatimonadetes bacterium]|nr:hypothetical protein [Gemmatimonadota bacterium]
MKHPISAIRATGAFATDSEAKKTPRALTKTKVRHHPRARVCRYWPSDTATSTGKPTLRSTS